MQNLMSRKKIYIVISQTGTILSRIIKLISGKEYNHASISLTRDLHTMYSFGRLNPYIPFFGGMVQESPHYGTFKRFSNTDVVVLSVEIDDEQYRAIKKAIRSMYYSRACYHYNYLGLCLAAFNIPFKPENSYYCSEFVRYLLQEGNVEGSDQFDGIIHPMSFLNMPDAEVIYSGKLRNYEPKPKLAYNT